MSKMNEFVDMNYCPITGYKLTGKATGFNYSVQNKANYVREWNKKNKDKVREKNRLKYQAKMAAANK